MDIAIGGYQVFQLLLFFWTFTLHPAWKFNVCKQPNKTQRFRTIRGICNITISVRQLYPSYQFERRKNIRKLLRHTYLLKWLIFNIETLVIKFALVSCPVLGQVCKVSFTKNEISKNQTLLTTIIVKSVLDSQWSKLYRRQNVRLFPEISSISYVRPNLPSVLRSPGDRMKSLFYLV